MKYVAIGDFHIPDRANEIPAWIVKRITQIKPDHILCTGDLVDETVLEFLRSLGNVVCVRGNMDWLDLPMHSKLVDGVFIIGVIHGQGIHPRGDLSQLSWYADKMGANILVHGHTHRLDIDLFKGKLYVNPGTATGVWGGATSGEPESFVEMHIKGPEVTIRTHKEKETEVYTYVMRNGEILTYSR